MRLTLGQRLWLGFGLLIALIAAAYVYVLREETLPPPQADATAAESVRAAVGQLQAALETVTTAVQGYPRNSGEAGQDAIVQARADFERALAELEKVATGEVQRAQLQDLSQRFDAASKQADAAVSAVDVSAQQTAAFERYRAEAATLIAQQPPIAGRPNRGRTLRKQNAVRELNAQLRARANEYGARAGGAAPQSNPSRTAMLANLERYEVLSDSRAERDWAARARAWIDQGEQQWNALVAATAAQRQTATAAQEAHESLQSFLVNQVQAGMSADLEARLEGLSARVQQERTRTQRLLLGLLALTALIALLTVLAVRAPLRRLAAMTRPYVDSDLSYQTFTLRGDETGELTVAVQWLIGRLQPPSADAQPVADEASARALQAFEQTRQPLAVLDAHGQVAQVNTAFGELAGHDPAALRGMHVDRLWSDDHHDPASIEAMWAFLQEQGEWQGELWIRDSADNVHPLWGNLSRVRDASGTCVGFVLTCSDVTMIRMAERQSLRSAAAGTPLSDAGMLAQRLRAGSSRARRYGLRTALLHIAVAQLEGVDRILGREEADALMKVAAQRLQRVMRGYDAILRMADDQFAVLLEDIGDAEQVRRVAEKILAEFSLPVELSGLELPLHAKIGIALAPDDGAAEELPGAAKDALARAGQTRGAAFAFFSADLNQRMWGNHALETELRRSDLEAQLALHYQPRVIAVEGQQMVAAQARLRWLHPEHGVLTPERFLGAAPADVVARLDAWQIEHACVQLAAWANAGAGVVPIALEMLAHRPEANELSTALQSALLRHAVAPRLLELEFPVSTLAVADQCERLFAPLSAAGVALTVIIDEVETFTASLGLLRRLPLARVKLDCTLVEGIAHGATEQAVARATLTLARSLGVELVADGVETQAQSVFLRTEGVLQQQGALFGQPAPAPALEVHRVQAAAGERSPALL